MASYSNATILGNLTRDPEKRYTDAGSCVVNLSVAVNSRRKVGNEWKDEASFFDVVVFGEQAENVAKYLSKGKPCLVSGELRQRRWEANDGTKRSKIEIAANRVVFLGGRDEQHSTTQSDDDDIPPPLDDDVPF